MTTATAEHLVIAGMAVEAPGGISGPEQYWSAIEQAKELIGPLPRDRGWPVEELLSVGRFDGWTAPCDAGGFLDGAGAFDAAFFGVSPAEAIAMDPQQRVAMRVAWRALENTGVDPAGLDGEQAGCFIGISPMEYGPRAGEINGHNGYRTLGMATLSAAGRISHNLGLVGPSLSIDSACASSVTALHYAAAAIRAGDCDWALVGSVSVMGSPMVFYEFAKNNALSSDGHCRSYAADPTGTLWAEGAGVVVVEPESRAHQLGHRVYGRILASHVNHNGKGRPILAPRADAQAAVIRRTVDRAGIDPALVGLIEGHGTATRAGDPAEITALQQTYGAAGGEPLLGSVKSNMGHAQAAAGIMGLIKLLLAAEHGTIPPSLFADNPTRAVDWDSSSLRLAAQSRPWEPIDGIRYGALSSFGGSGANAHAVIAIPEHAEDDND